MRQSASNVLSDEEVRTLSFDILKRELEEFGVSGTQAREEEDFDGSYILRVIIDASKDIPARKLGDALEAIRSQLIDRGDERFVYLSVKEPQQGATVDEESD